MQLEELHRVMEVSHQILHGPENTERRQLVRGHEHTLAMDQRRL